MKKKRGRPPEKSYPKPHTSAESFDTAVYGKLGASEAMSLLRDCPYPTIDYIQKKAPKERDRVEKKLLKWAPKLQERWLHRIGPIIGKKIAAGDAEFFPRLGNAVEEFSKERRAIASDRRYLALRYKLFCDAMNVPFTRKGLCDIYKKHKLREIDSGTLSKMMRWAESAELSYDDLIQELGPPRIRVGPQNQIL